MIDIDATLKPMSPAIPAGGSDELPRVASLGDKLRRGSVLVALTSAYDASGAISVAQALQLGLAAEGSGRLEASSRRSACR